MPIILLDSQESSDSSGGAATATVTLNDLEDQILQELGEDTSDPKVWDGDPDLREAICDALDEIGMASGCFKTKLTIPLVANTAFYDVSLGDGYPLWVTDVRIVENDNRLIPKSIGRMCNDDERFLLSRGTPIEYASISPNIILLAPCTGSSTDVVILSVVYVPYHYAVHNEYLTMRQELENALIHYGKYHKLLGVRGSFESSMEEYQQYLNSLGVAQAVRDHSQALRKVRFGGKEDTQYGSKG